MARGFGTTFAVITAMSRGLHWLVLPLALALIGAVGSEAMAKRSVVVLDIDGSGSKAVRRAVMSAAKKNFKVVKRSKYTKTARKMDAESMNKRDVKRVARKVGVDAVVYGTVKKKNGKRQLYLIVRDGRTGKKVERYKIPVKKKGMSKKNVKTLARKLREGVRRSRDVDDDANEERSERRRDRVAAREERKRADKAERKRADKAERKRADKAERKRAAIERREQEAEAAESEERRAAKEKKRAAKEKRKAEKQRREQEAADAEREERRAAKKKRRAEKEKKRKEREAEENRKRLEVKTDDKGQAIDDEVPPGF